MNLSDLIRLKSFWNSISFLVAGLSGLAYLFEWIPLTWVVAPATFLSIVYAVLGYFDIYPEFMAKRNRALEDEAKKPKSSKRSK